MNMQIQATKQTNKQTNKLNQPPTEKKLSILDYQSSLRIVAIGKFYDFLNKVLGLEGTDRLVPTHTHSWTDSSHDSYQTKFDTHLKIFLNKIAELDPTTAQQALDRLNPFLQAEEITSLSKPQSQGVVFCTTLFGCGSDTDTALFNTMCQNGLSKIKTELKKKQSESQRSNNNNNLFQQKQEDNNNPQKSLIKKTDLFGENSSLNSSVQSSQKPQLNIQNQQEQEYNNNDEDRESDTSKQLQNPYEQYNFQKSLSLLKQDNKSQQQEKSEESQIKLDFQGYDLTQSIIQPPQQQQEQNFLNPDTLSQKNLETAAFKNISFNTTSTSLILTNNNGEPTTISLKLLFESLENSIDNLPEELKERSQKFWKEAKDQFIKNTFVQHGQSKIQLPQKKQLSRNVEENLNALFSFIFDGSSFDNGIRNFLKKAQTAEQVKQFLTNAFAMLVECLKNENILKAIKSFEYGHEDKVSNEVKSLPTYLNFKSTQDKLNKATQINQNLQNSKIFQSNIKSGPSQIQNSQSIQNIQEKKQDFIAPKVAAETLYESFYTTLGLNPPSDGVKGFLAFDITKSDVKGNLIEVVKGYQKVVAKGNGIPLLPENKIDKSRTYFNGDTSGNAPLSLLDRIAQGGIQFTQEGLEKFVDLFTRLLVAEKGLQSIYNENSYDLSCGSDEKKKEAKQLLATPKENYQVALTNLSDFIKNSDKICIPKNVTIKFLGDNQGDRMGIDLTWQKIFSALNDRRETDSLPLETSLFGNHELFCLKGGHYTAASFYIYATVFPELNPYKTYLEFFIKNTKLVDYVETKDHFILLTHALPDVKAFEDLITAFKEADNTLDVHQHLSVIEQLKKNTPPNKEEFKNMLDFINAKFQAYLGSLLTNYKKIFPDNDDIKKDYNGSGAENEVFSFNKGYLGQIAINGTNEEFTIENATKTDNYDQKFLPNYVYQNIVTLTLKNSADAIVISKDHKPHTNPTYKWGEATGSGEIKYKDTTMSYANDAELKKILCVINPNIPPCELGGPLTRNKVYDFVWADTPWSGRGAYERIDTDPLLTEFANNSTQEVIQVNGHTNNTLESQQLSINPYRGKNDQVYDQNLIVGYIDSQDQQQV